jgi:hypothetical protein
MTGRYLKRLVSAIPDDAIVMIAGDSDAHIDRVVIEFDTTDGHTSADLQMTRDHRSQFQNVELR